MDFTLVKRIIGAIVFLASLLTLIATVQPSVSFWDCGEFIAASYYLQVPHPPGTPVFLLLGRLFSMVPFVENIGLRVNYISVLSSAFSILFLYLVAVRLIENYKGKEHKNLLDALTTYIAAAIGALSFSFSDTFWFNAVEAEVYAFSTFLFAAITWLMMRWHDRADNPGNEKYLIMIAYLIGLSTGVHLMSVLAIVPVVMVILFRKYVNDDEAAKKSGYIFLGHAGLLLIISIILWSSQTSNNSPSPEEYQAFDSRFKLIIAGVSAVLMGIFWKKLFNRNSFYMPLIIGGIALFVTYPGVVKVLPGLMANIGGDNIVTELLLLAIVFGGVAYAIYYAVKENKATLHLAAMSFLFIVLGFTTYSMVIIRANQDPPMNENEPNDFTELVSYLNREQYGDFPTFKRRFATEPHQQIVYTNYTSDFDFFWRYQMNHMMTRYLMWNYAGRESWVQDSGVNIWPFNKLGDAIFKPFDIKFGGEAKDSLYGIPFLLGILGIFFHFRRDWKMASVFMIAFILMGYLTAFYQNQQQPQPRERDYFYVGAFFIFSIWIAIAVRGVVDFANNKLRNVNLAQGVTVLILAACFILVPVKMFSANYFTHDRSNNWVPWDYSYNLLQSCAPNAILFTNGDNDTFPLWYLQDVEGVRRDVRIANLSLLNTPWYIRQLKNLEPYGARKVDMRLTDEQIARLRPQQWEPQDVSIPIPGNVNLFNIEGNLLNINDSTVLKEGRITFRMNNTIQFGDIKAIRVQDIMVKEIIEASRWERPIYFAVTCSEDSKIGLSDYLKMEGMAFRLVPEKRQAGVEFVNEPILRAQLYNENPEYDFNYKPGFKFRGLNDPTIFFDDNHIRMTQNYRNAFIRLAVYYLNNGDKKATVETLDLMNEKMPRDLLKIDYRILFDVANIYNGAGAKDRYEELAREIEKTALEQIKLNPTDVSSYYNPYRLLIDIYDNLEEYNKAADILSELQAMYPNDPMIKNEIERYRSLQAAKDTISKK